MQCAQCYSNVQKSQQDLKCTMCKLLFHRTCLGITSDEYNIFNTQDWKCTKCTDTNRAPLCYLCKGTKTRRRKYVQCQLCQLEFHSACVKEENKLHKPDDFYWICAPCQNKKDEINVSVSESTSSHKPAQLKGISIGFLNVRDMMASNKKDDILNITHEYQFHVFGICESWLHENIADEELIIPSYTLYRQDRPNIKSYKQRGGGLLLYVKQDYTVERHNDAPSSIIEVLHISISKPNLKNIHIILVYRPPKSNKLQLMETIKHHMKLCKNEEAYFIGDFNADMLKNDPIKIELSKYMADHNFDQLIKTPTRTTASTATVLDCIFTNKPQYNQFHGTIDSNISDHDIAFTCRKKCKTTKSAIKTIEKCFKNANYDAMRKMIKEAPWWIMEYCDNINKKYNMFHTILLHVLNTHAPYKKIRVKAARKIWMNATYDNLSRKVTKARNAFKNHRTEENFLHYKKTRNQMNHLKTQLKCNVIKNIAKQNVAGNSKQIWQILNTEVGRVTTNNVISEINENGVTIFDNKEKLNALCRHFTQNPTNEHCNIEMPGDLPEIGSPQDDNPKLEKIRVCPDDVEQVIMHLETDKPTGIDGLPARFFKACATEIAFHLALLINEMMKSGIFPDSLKIARIKPIYKKKGEKNLTKNYRPISILPTSTKIIDKIICDRFMKYFEDNNILMNEQHGYRKNRSTQSAVLILNDDIKEGSDRSKITGAVFFDFSQAFDKVQYSSLLKKFQHYGISNQLLKFLHSYYNNRKMVVNENGVNSDTYNMIQGTPQGSGASSMTWLVYVNDSQNIFEQCKFIYYCDDLVLYANGNTIAEVQEKLQIDINNLTKWCAENGMEINISKTKSMLFRPRSNLTSAMNLSLYGKTIENVKEFKYLGVIIQDNLKYEKHYEITCAKMTARVHMITRQKNHFTARWKKIFVTSLVLSILDYCLPVWGNLAVTKWKRLNKIMLRAAKMVIKARHFKKPSKLDRVEHLNWLLCHERIDVYTLNFLFKNIWRQTSLTTSFQLIRKRENFTRSSRQESNFIVPVIKKEIGRSTFSFRAITLWNNLPPEIRQTHGIKLFDSLIRKYIMSKRDNNVMAFI